VTRAQRLLALLQALRRHRHPVASSTLAAEMNVAVGKIYRDIQTLVEQGASIEGEAGLGYVLKRGFLLPPLMFSAEEAEAILLGDAGRRSIHRSVARAIETLFADRLDELTSLLAYHYALAEDWERAQVYLLKAGNHAGRIAADAEALEHYRQAEATFMKVGGGDLTSLQRAAMDRKLG
jgi:biotin operon repressor